MAKTQENRQNHRDPRYPYHSRVNEEGQTIYSIPLLAPEDTTLKTPVLEASETAYTDLTIFGGKPIRVHFAETTDRKWAYEQNSFLNIYHTDEERYDARFMLLKTYEGPDPGDTIWDRFSASHCHEDGYTIAEYSDLPGRVAKYIDERYPQNGLYAQVYLMSVVGYEVKEIAEMIGTDLQMTYYYQRTAYAVAREYRKKYFDEGQFTFPKDKPQKSTAAKRDKKGEKPDDTEEAMNCFDPYGDSPEINPGCRKAFNGYDKDY